MLSESARNWIVQVALDYVDGNGKMPDDPFADKEEEQAFWNMVKEIKEDRAAGHHYTYDVAYSYD